MATKQTRPGSNWKWFDWALFVLICISVQAVFRIRLGDILGSFVVGAIVGGLYSVTLRRLWAFAFPTLYSEWACSACQTGVPGEAVTCPKCGSEFAAQLAA